MLEDLAPEELAALRAKLRARNPPKRELAGEERDHMLTLVALLTPDEFLTTHSIVARYDVNGTTVEVTQFFSDIESIVEVYESEPPSAFFVQNQ